jgi:membrane protease YdiL (CAAX protease family)
VSLVKSVDGRVRSGWVIVTFAVIAGLIEFGALLAVELAGLGGAGKVEGRLFFLTLPSLVAGLVATAVCWKSYGELTGLEHARPLRQLGLGFAGGALAIVVACVVPALVGAQELRFNREWSPLSAIGQFIALAPAGIGEELLLRGLAFQALRRGLGDVVAVSASGLIFGVMHLTNPHASWVAAVIIALVGLWFSAAMVRGNNLYVPMGLHLGWNFFEGCIFGQPVSGLAPGNSLFVAGWPTKASFWSGGDFGPEAAGWTAVVLAIGLGLTVFARRRSLT